MTAIDTTVELAAPTNLLNPPRFSPVVVTPAIVKPAPNFVSPAMVAMPVKLRFLALISSTL